MPKRPLLSDSAIAPKALAKMASFQESTRREVQDAVEAHDVVVVGMAQNPNVWRARRALAAAGVSFHDLEYGSYLSGWRRRLGIKLWSGWPTFPQVFVRGTLLGGANEAEAAIADGTLPGLIAAPRAAAPDL